MGPLQSHIPSMKYQAEAMRGIKKVLEQMSAWLFRKIIKSIGYRTNPNYYDLDTKSRTGSAEKYCWINKSIMGEQLYSEAQRKWGPQEGTKDYNRREGEKNHKHYKTQAKTIHSFFLTSLHRLSWKRSETGSSMASIPSNPIPRNFLYSCLQTFHMEVRVG